MFPTLHGNTRDSLRWLSPTHEERDFSVYETYTTLDGSHPIIPWCSAAWFPGHIPKHAFYLWVAFHKRHPTQDRIVSWKNDPPEWS
ncbi:hypothetical protein OSB04_un001251 [Centaurea solstitialis]|uniref:Reverse transcriptase zinc-binding domain-containing protein n=1 Tax=Centaurea solstitialis TaxID=347529 RepID=A0AA38W555_9ASTR|nr:hypothetical protein OSB04_un001251 [Centaurea solstitialis]